MLPVSSLLVIRRVDPLLLTTTGTTVAGEQVLMFLVRNVPKKNLMPRRSTRVCRGLLLSILAVCSVVVSAVGAREAVKTKSCVPPPRHLTTIPSV